VHHLATVDLVGWAATLLGSVYAVPQLGRLIRTRRTEGLSLIAWQAVLVLNLAYVVHGARIGQAPQLLTSLLGLGSSLPLVVLISRRRGQPAGWSLGPAALVAAGLIAVDVVIGSAAFGVLTVVPAVLANAGSSAQLIRACSLTGVSPASVVLAVVNQVLWVTWAVLVPDAGTTVTGGVMTVLTCFNLVWWTARRLGAVGPLPPGAAVRGEWGAPPPRSTSRHPTDPRQPLLSTRQESL
jgi:uncharacterized protein with PQ loop repeat